MAQRERLGHLKFMQRARLREEVDVKVKKDQAAASSEQWVASSKSSGSSCVVIVESDPKPSSVSGRMSFRSFNPSFEVSQEQAESIQKAVVTTQETTVKSCQQSTVNTSQQSTSHRS